MFNGVGYTGVLGYALVIEIDLALCIQSNIFKQSITADGIVDIWLRLLIQVDYLCVAAAFEVEYSVVIPAVLIITNQQSLWICGQSGLSSAGQAKEDSGIFTIHISICGTVHCGNAL